MSGVNDGASNYWRTAKQSARQRMQRALKSIAEEIELANSSMIGLQKSARAEMLAGEVLEAWQKVSTRFIGKAIKGESLMSPVKFVAYVYRSRLPLGQLEPHIRRWLQGHLDYAFAETAETVAKLMEAR